VTADGHAPGTPEAARGAGDGPEQLCGRSADSHGRLRDEPECSVRTCFERDVGRIIFSMDFRRMRHKTQVFFNPQSDHICTRMEHVISVNYIAGTIGRVLG
jgi:dGTPase